MIKLAHSIFLLLALLSLGASARADVTIQSGPGRANLLELYTSEGCSSCPPAESWFSTLRQSPRLWKDVVPVAFHITYWDDLGWTDSLAAPAFTGRQRAFAAAWGAPNVYTPEFVLNGREWRGRDLDSIPTSRDDAGKLSATIKKTGEVDVSFQPPSETSGKWEAHAALLGYGVTSDVRAGENSGRRLVHDFVVLALVDAAMSDGSLRGMLKLSSAKITPGRSAIAVWVTRAGHLEPVQAAGGNL